MGDVLPLLLSGFQIALQPHNLGFALLGAFLGTVIGVLPGVGPAGALALLLPLVLNMSPVSAIIMLSALYMGAMYGGSTTSILLNVPGETSSVVTCLDGYAMAKQGRAGPALCIAAIGSFIAGTLGVVGLMLFAPLIAGAALQFGPPEYFALMVFGLSAVASLAADSLVKGLMAMVIGLMIATVGTDVTGVARFTFGFGPLLDGIEFLTVTIGLFAVSEVLLSTRDIKGGTVTEVIKHRLFISWREIVESVPAMLRGTGIGFRIGVLPGTGAGTAAFLSFPVETQLSRHPERFGKGEIAASRRRSLRTMPVPALVPTLTLGVPGPGTTVRGGAHRPTMHPGPFMFTDARMSCGASSRLSTSAM
jgi:putative tricarboxylic transport membrane protein